MSNFKEDLLYSLGFFALIALCHTLLTYADPIADALHQFAVAWIGGVNIIFEWVWGLLS